MNSYKLKSQNKVNEELVGSLISINNEFGLSLGFVIKSYNDKGFFVKLLQSNIPLSHRKNWKRYDVNDLSGYYTRKTDVISVVSGCKEYVYEDTPATRVRKVKVNFREIDRSEYYKEGEQPQTVKICILNNSFYQYNNYALMIVKRNNEEYGTYLLNIDYYYNINSDYNINSIINELYSQVERVRGY